MESSPAASSLETPRVASLQHTGDCPPPLAPRLLLLLPFPGEEGAGSWGRRGENAEQGAPWPGGCGGQVALTSGLFSTGGSSQRLSTLKKYQGRPSR